MKQAVPPHIAPEVPRGSLPHWSQSCGYKVGAAGASCEDLLSAELQLKEIHPFLKKVPVCDYFI